MAVARRSGDRATGAGVARGECEPAVLRRDCVAGQSPRPRGTAVERSSSEQSATSTFLNSSSRRRLRRSRVIGSPVSLSVSSVATPAVLVHGRDSAGGSSAWSIFGRAPRLRLKRTAARRQTSADQVPRAPTRSIAAASDRAASMHEPASAAGAGSRRQRRVVRVGPRRPRLRCISARPRQIGRGAAPSTRALPGAKTPCSGSFNEQPRSDPRRPRASPFRPSLPQQGGVRPQVRGGALQLAERDGSTGHPRELDGGRTLMLRSA
jgi:hypothetical protein